MRDRVVRASALGAGRGGDAADPVKEVTHTVPTRNRSGAVTGPVGGAGEEVSLLLPTQKGEERPVAPAGKDSQIQCVEIQDSHLSQEAEGGGRRVSRALKGCDAERPTQRMGHSEKSNRFR